MITQHGWKVLAIALLGGIAALAIDRTLLRAGAAGATDNNGDMIAVTGDYGNGTSVLYVIDTKAKHLAVYRSVNGNTVELVGARRIEHDLRLWEFNDRSSDSHRVLNLEKQYDDYQRRATGKDPYRPSGAPTSAPSTAESRPAPGGREKN